MWQNHQIYPEPTVFCFSLVKSKPAWPHAEEFKCETKKHSFCMNVDNSKVQSADGNVCPFPMFPGQLVSSVWFHFRHFNCFWCGYK